MRIATFNVNSLRARMPRVTDWLAGADLDVVALQETKLKDGAFPAAAFAEMGYTAAFHGLSQWNGVALLSRVGLEDVQVGFPGMPGWGDPVAPEARAISAVCGGGRIWSLYVPNGRTLEDPHLDYKLEWLHALAAAGRDWLAADPDAAVALLGDWNVAPQDDDVWSIAVFEGHTHVSAPERAAFADVVDAGFSDVVRPFTPGEFTYWDYQRLRFPRREGMRIDHVLASPALARRVTGAKVDRDMRKGKQPSDHAPVIVEFD